jgi:membrane protein implicated in regulation of membrane protease activity
LWWQLASLVLSSSIAASLACIPATVLVVATRKLSAFIQHCSELGLYRRLYLWWQLASLVLSSIIAASLWVGFCDEWKRAFKNTHRRYVAGVTGSHHFDGRYAVKVNSGQLSWYFGGKTVRPVRPDRSGH